MSKHEIELDDAAFDAAVYEFVKHESVFKNMGSEHYCVEPLDLKGVIAWTLRAYIHATQVQGD